MIREHFVVKTLHFKKEGLVINLGWEDRKKNVEADM